MSNRFVFSGACTLLACMASLVGSQSVRSDTIVRMAHAPQHAGIARLVPEITIGGPDATDDKYTFDQIHALVAQRDGTIWISDGRGLAGRALVRQYDSTGKFLRHIGRRGQGPGEWQNPDELAPLPDGRVLLRDAVVPNPITIYKADGAYDTTLTFRQTVFNAYADVNGIIWIRLSLGGGMAMGGGGSIAYVRMRSNGKVIDTIVPPAIEKPPARNDVHVTRTNAPATMVAAPFQPSAYYAWSTGGYLAGLVTTRYAVNLLMPPVNRAPGAGGTPAIWRPGDPVTSIRREAPPVVVGDDERRDRYDNMVAQVRSLDAASHTPIPEVAHTKLPISRVVFDYDARVWVQVAAPSEKFTPPEPPAPRPGQRAPVPPLRWREPTVYDVFERSGAYVGQVRMPVTSSMRPRYIDIWVARGDHIWIVERDNDGVESVHRYRIEWDK
ncbi:MAG TPA: hypothetical protein VE967_08430 [Gemmatimonadaceae bacterium]|nr:hypothetical protein [Gemmatimonadaceae bacterium]